MDFVLRVLAWSNDFGFPDRDSLDQSTNPHAQYPYCESQRIMIEREGIAPLAHHPLLRRVTLLRENELMSQLSLTAAGTKPAADHRRRVPVYRVTNTFPCVAG
jgi:hypothetical protein